jgi:hypothetical protein
MQDVKLGKLDEEGLGISDVETALGRVGIKVRENATTFRNMDAVILDLSKTWSTLNDVEQSSIAKSVAGTRQRENFLVLMNNFDEVLRLQAESAGSSGLAMERYGIYLEETEAKMNVFKATAEALWLKTISSDTIQKVIELGTSLLEMVKGFGLINTILPIGLTLFATYNKSIRTLTTSFIASKFAKDAETITTNKNTVATTANSIAINARNAALTFGLSIAITAVIAGITAVITNMTQALEIQKQKVYDLSDGINVLTESISTLKEKGGLTSSEIVELDLLERQLFVQNELLKIEETRLMNKELFGKGLGDGVKQEIEDIA